MNEQQQSRLITLPPELCNTIYSLDFAPKQPSAAHEAPHTRPLFEISSAWLEKHESFLLTCKLVKSEAYGFYVAAYRSFWHETTFTLAASDILVAGRRQVYLREQLAGVSTSDMANITCLAFDTQIEDIVLSSRLSLRGRPAICSVDLEHGRPMRPAGCEAGAHRVACGAC